MHRTRVAVIAWLAALSLPVSAHADELIADTSGSRNLTTFGSAGVPVGFGALRREPAVALWAQPTGDGRSGEGAWRLAIRRAGSAPNLLAVADFMSAPAAQIDSSGPLTYAYYSRCTNGTSDCDIVRLDLASGMETRVPGASSANADETAPSIDGGLLAFVRSTGPRRGIYTLRLDRRSQPPRRLATAIPLETAVLKNISRVAYVYRSAAGFGIAARGLRGSGPVRIASRLDERPRNLRLATQYRVAWLTDVSGGVSFSLSRQIRGHSDLSTPIAGNRPLPEGTDSFSGSGIDSRPSYYLAAGKLWRADPGLIAFRG